MGVLNRPVPGEAAPRGRRDAGALGASGDVQLLARSVVHRESPISSDSTVRPIRLGPLRGRRGADPGLDRNQLLLPLRPGQLERQTYDYVRHGTTSLVTALDPHRGRVIERQFRRHRAVEFRKLLDAIAAAVVLRRGVRRSTRVVESGHRTLPAGLQRSTEASRLDDDRR